MRVIGVGWHAAQISGPRSAANNYDEPKTEEGCGTVPSELEAAGEGTRTADATSAPAILLSSSVDANHHLMSVSACRCDGVADPRRP